MLRRFVAALAVCAAFSACTGETGTYVDPHSVVVMPQRWPSAVAAAPNDAPRIIALWLSSDDVAPGSDWSGHIATTTNVASLEIRTESFSFNATRTTYGQFAFRQHILDIVPQYKRHYTLAVIARNAAGKADIRLVPIDVR
jgi:hypothetical protein